MTYKIRSNEYLNSLKQTDLTDPKGNNLFNMYAALCKHGKMQNFEDFCQLRIADVKYDDGEHFNASDDLEDNRDFLNDTL